MAKSLDSKGTEQLLALAKLSEHDGHVFHLMEQLSRLNMELDSKRRPLDEATRLLEEVELPYQEMEKEINSCQQTAKVAQETSARFESHLNRLKEEEERNQAKKQITEAKRAYDLLQEQIRQRHQKQLEIRGELEVLRQQYQEANQNFERHTQGLETTRLELKKSIGSAEKVLKTEIVKLDHDLRSCYEKLVKTGKRPATAAVIKNCCGGCHMELPPREYNLLLASNGKLNQCSHCYRITFIPAAYLNEEPPAEETPTKKTPTKKTTGKSTPKTTEKTKI